MMGSCLGIVRSESSAARSAMAPPCRRRRAGEPAVGVLAFRSTWSSAACRITSSADRTVGIGGVR